MTSVNALIFSLFGLVMWLLSIIAPGCFPTIGIESSSARALWLQVLGLTQAAIGFFCLIRNRISPALKRWLASVPQPTGVLAEGRVPADVA